MLPDEEEYERISAKILELQRERAMLAEKIMRRRVKSFSHNKDCLHKKITYDLRDEHRMTQICLDCGRTWHNGFA